MFGEILQGLRGHIAWPGGQITWPGSHQFRPFFLCFSAQLYFFPCIIVLAKIFSLGAQKHTKRDTNICFQLSIL
jgi:hypothetical protein